MTLVHSRYVSSSMALFICIAYWLCDAGDRLTGAEHTAPPLRVMELLFAARVNVCLVCMFFEQVVTDQFKFELIRRIATGLVALVGCGKR